MTIRNKMTNTKSLNVNRLSMGAPCLRWRRAAAGLGELGTLPSRGELLLILASLGHECIYCGGKTLRIDLAGTPHRQDADATALPLGVHGFANAVAEEVEGQECDA